MSSIVPSLPQGCRDIDPQTLRKRMWLMDTLKALFEKAGFEPLVTPAMENLTTLLGKYGQDGERLIFKILNSGNFKENLSQEVWQESASSLSFKIAKKGLRYDLTVPLARYVAKHHKSLILPFKRYQIQPVWRADRPQKGRFREFVQCDMDVVGSRSLFFDAELLSIVHHFLAHIGLQQEAIVHLNHRALFPAMAQYIGIPGQEALLCQCLDKLDKVGKKRIQEMLGAHGVSFENIQKLEKIFTPPSDPQEGIAQIDKLLGHLPAAALACQELRQIWHYLDAFGVTSSIRFTPTLARGLDYYTGAIFEANVPGSGIGSIVGGGRYDHLTELFGVKNMSGVGLSFGIDRIYALLEARNYFKDSPLFALPSLLFVPMDAACEAQAIAYLVSCRKAGIAAQCYPAEKRMKKVFAYADKKKIDWVVVIGSEELQSNLLSLKNMTTGSQKTCTFAEVISVIRKEIKKTKNISWT